MALTTVQNQMTAMGNSGASYEFVNRIINGAMVIDQRNAGASGTALGYTVDRFAYDASQASKLTWQQNAASVTPPTGFSNYLGFTSSSAYSVTSGDYFYLYHRIEGFNTADLAFGTANASSVTLSFWVRSSLTGTFGGALRNGASSYSYPFTYTISSANTWTKVVITVAGPTAGTWVGATNGIGLQVVFGLGAGTTYSGTAGSWSSNNYVTATGAQSVVGTNGATWYLTGVQLEKGSSASAYEYRDYTRELTMCQRYYSKSYNPEVAPNTQTNEGPAGGITQGSDRTTITHFFKTQMRAAPTVTIISYLGNNGYITATNGTNAGSSCAAALIGTSCLSEVYSGGTALSSLTIYRCHYTASAEL